jgi:hypothetical protein
MKIIKLYEAFWNKKKEESNNDLEFDFLSAVGKLKKAINKAIEVHEQHYYNDSKIVNSEEFQSELKSNIDKILSSDGLKTLITEDFCDLVHKFESSLYNDNKFGIDSGYDYSIFGIFDDLISNLRGAIREKNERSVSFLDKESQHILDKCDDSWVYVEDERASKIIDDFLDNDEFEKTLNDWVEEEDENDIGMWTSEEDFEKDIESYIGKKMDNFDYSDKLQAYQYIENKTWVQNILEEGSEKDKDFINNFLSQMKDLFGI